MTSLSNLAEANVYPRGIDGSALKGVSHAGQFIYPLSRPARRETPGFFFIQGLTRLLPPLKGLGFRRQELR